MRIINISSVAFAIASSNLSGCKKSAESGNPDVSAEGTGAMKLSQGNEPTIPEIQFSETRGGDWGLIDIKPMPGQKSLFDWWEMLVRSSMDFELVKKDFIKFQDMILHFERYLSDDKVNQLKKKILTRAKLFRSNDMDVIICGNYVGALKFQPHTIADPKRVCALFQLIKEYATSTMGPRLVMSVADRHLTVLFESGDQIHPARVSDLKSWVLPVPQKYDIEAVKNIIEKKIDRLIGISDYFRVPAVEKKGLMFESITVTQSTTGDVIKCEKEVGTVTLSIQIGSEDPSKYCGYLLSFKQEIFDELDAMARSHLTHTGNGN